MTTSTIPCPPPDVDPGELLNDCVAALLEAESSHIDEIGGRSCPVCGESPGEHFESRPGCGCRLHHVLLRAGYDTPEKREAGREALKSGNHVAQGYTFRWVDPPPEAPPIAVHSACAAFGLVEPTHHPINGRPLVNCISVTPYVSGDHQVVLATFECEDGTWVSGDCIPGKPWRWQRFICDPPERPKPHLVAVVNPTLAKGAS